MKRLSIAAALALIVCAAGAQTTTNAPARVTADPPSGEHPFPDSIRIEFRDQSAILVFQFKTAKAAIGELKSAYGELAPLMKNIEAALPEQKTAREITAKSSEPGSWVLTIRDQTVRTTRILVEKGEATELLPPGWQLSVNSKSYKLAVYAPSFDQLRAVSSIDPTPIADLIRTRCDIPGRARKRIVARIIVDSGTIVYDDIKLQAPADFLELNGGAGIGIMGNNVYPELNASIVVARHDHANRPGNRFALTYNNLFFMERRSDGGYSLNTNSFLNLSWSINIGGNNTFIGVGAGALILRQGDYFKGKTMKFFISKSFGRVNLAPEMYLTNGLKDVQMGFRMAYTF